MTIYDIELRNRQAGFFWFEPATKRFFKSRVSETVYEGPGGVFFVSSEKGPSGRRMYSVRRFNKETGDISTAGEFQGYLTRNAAHAKAAVLAAFKEK